MRILLDAGLSTLAELTGIGQQCLGLHRSLSKYADTTLHTYEILRGLPKVLRRALYTAASNLLVSAQRFDVIHFVNHQATWMPARAAKAVTIHDLTPFLFPECLPPLYAAYARKAIEVSVRRADLIIVPSASVREELNAHFGKLPAEIACCPNGLRDSLRKAGRRRAASSEGYFLFVGTLEKRKNVAALARVFLEAKRSGELQKGSALLLAGRKGYGFDEVEHTLPADGSVRVLGHVPDEKLAELYQHAKALVLPSVYEGFGVPLIEAMWFGLPIIRSDFSAGRELDWRHNNQMLHFAVGDDRSLKEMLVHVDKNWQRLGKKLDYGDLSVYDYDAVARQHLAAYERVL